MIKVSMCKQIINNCRNRIILLCKRFTDEHAQSMQLYSFLSGLMKLSIKHTHFGHHNELASVLMSELKRVIKAERDQIIGGRGKKKERKDRDENA